jgi:hypothetical protein
MQDKNIQDKYKKYKLKYLNLKKMVGGAKLLVHFNYNKTHISFTVDREDLLSKIKEELRTKLNISEDLSIKFIKFINGINKELRDDRSYADNDIQKNDTIKIITIGQDLNLIPETIEKIFDVMKQYVQYLSRNKSTYYLLSLFSAAFIEENSTRQELPECVYRNITQQFPIKFIKKCIDDRVPIHILLLDQIFLGEIPKMFDHDFKFTAEHSTIGEYNIDGIVVPNSSEPAYISFGEMKENDNSNRCITKTYNIFGGMTLIEKKVHYFDSTLLIIIEYTYTFRLDTSSRDIYIQTISNELQDYIEITELTFKITEIGYVTPDIENFIDGSQLNKMQKIIIQGYQGNVIYRSAFMSMYE